MSNPEVGSPPELPGTDGWRFIGEGPSTEVWEATQADFHRAVAVKVFGGDPGSRAAARRRAAAMGRLSGCTGSLPVLRVVELSAGRIAVITPLMSGSLRDLCADPDAVDPELWERWFVEACAALEAIHRSADVHGNIHAGNVMVSGLGAVVLADAQSDAHSDAVVDDDDGAAGGSAAGTEARHAEDLRALVGALFEVAPSGSSAVERLGSLLGTRGGHLGDLGIGTAAELADFVARELRRPVAAGPDRASAAGSLPTSRARRLWLAGALVGLVSVAFGALFLLATENDGSKESLTAGGEETPTDNGDGEGADGVEESGKEGAVAVERERVSGTALDISVSDHQACSLLSTGEAACWGMNLILSDNRQGSESYDPDFDLRPFPLQGGPFDAVEIGSDGTGNEILCASSEGSVSCRGWGIVGVPDDLAEVDFNRSDLLYPVPGVATAVDVTVAAEHACALLEDDTVHCWGSNTLGQLGNGERADSYDSAPVVGLEGVEMLSAGAMTTCALKADRSVWCWGATRPPLGSSPVPEQVAGLPEATQVSAGRSIICAVDTSGRLWCWGDFEAAFGVRNPEFFTPPTVMETDEPVQQVAVGDQELCAVGSSGAVWCWETASATPRRITGIADAVAVDTYRGFSCALLANGSVTCWGFVTQDDAAGDSPVPIEGLGPE